MELTACLLFEQNGIIKLFQNSSSVSSIKVFLDITDWVSLESTEMGLLGLAFHPDYKNNGYLYKLHNPLPSRMTRISHFNVSDTNPNSADKIVELILITLDQPFNIIKEVEQPSVLMDIYILD